MYLLSYMCCRILTHTFIILICEEHEESSEPASSSHLKRLQADGVSADTAEEGVPQKKGWFLF